MIDLNFGDDQNHIITPYHTAGFWLQTWTDNHENNSINIVNKLCNISYGIEWLFGEIYIEVYSITSQRLLQNGATNVLTYDFETRQNLIEGWCNRHQYIYKITNNKNLNPGKLRYTPLEDNQTSQLFDDDVDTITKKEIPQKYEYKRIINFPSLTHNCLYKPIPTTNINIGTLIPGAQNINKYEKGTVTNNSNIIG